VFETPGLVDAKLVCLGLYNVLHKAIKFPILPLIKVFSIEILKYTSAIICIIVLEKNYFKCSDKNVSYLSTDDPANSKKAQRCVTVIETPQV
jgi:hypothetical protein